MYGVEQYSTMKPATSSDSASTRSNGGRLVSASAETKNTTNIGNSQQPIPAEAGRRSELLRLDDVGEVKRAGDSRTVMITKPIETS